MLPDLVITLNIVVINRFYDIQQGVHPLRVNIVLNIELGCIALFPRKLVEMLMPQRLMHGDRPEGRTADAKDDKAFAVVPDPLRRLVYCRQVLALRAVQLAPAQTVTLGIDALKSRTHFLRHCGELLRLNAVFTHGRGEHVVVIDMNLHVLFLIIHEKRTPPHDIVQLYHITLSRSNAMTILIVSSSSGKNQAQGSSGRSLAQALSRTAVPVSLPQVRPAGACSFSKTLQS